MSDPNADLDCFVKLGKYSVCTVTTELSVFSNIFLLMAQAVVSRILAPGISYFADSSVSNLLDCSHSRCLIYVKMFRCMSYAD